MVTQEQSIDPDFFQQTITHFWKPSWEQNAGPDDFATGYQANEHSHLRDIEKT